MFNMKKQIDLTWLLFFFVSFLISLLMLAIYENNETYQWLFLLPMTYGIMAILCSNFFNNIKKSKVIAIIVIGYFIKMVIAPFLFALGDYNSFFLGYVIIDSMNQAILFIIYEFIVIFSIATLSLRNRDFTSHIQIESEKFSGTQRLFFIIILLCFFIIFSYNFVPEIKNIYLFITDYQVDDLVGIRWDNETIVARGSIQRYIYSLFMFLWPLVRFLLPAVLIRLNYQKRGNTKKSIFLSTLTLIIPFIFLGGDNLAPFVAALFALLVIIKLYGQSGKKIAILFGILGTVFLIGTIIGKLDALSNWRGATGITNLAQMLNSYIPGFDNTAIALKMNDPHKVSTFFLDIVSGIPFIGSFINVSGDTLNDIFVRVANTGGQIVPWGSGIGYYFSYFISPFISVMFVWFLLYKEEKSNNTSDFWTYYTNMIFSLYSAFAMIIYSTQIYIRFIWNILIPVLIILYITKAKERKKYDGVGMYE